MRILFGIQATGNGHLSRAREILPALSKIGNVDVVVSGTNAEITIQEKPNYSFHGIGYSFGKNGSIQYWETLKNIRLLKSVRDMYSLPVKKYDLIVNDFEPISAYAGKMCKVPVIALSHQAAFLSPKTPRPTHQNHLGEFIFKHYAPCDAAVGLHFENFDHFIETPVIRSEVRELEPTNGQHIVVYLPAYADFFLANFFEQIKEVPFHVFSKHAKMPYRQGNVFVWPIINDDFIRKMASSIGVITGAGFEGPSEAMYLGKKLFCIPMQGQYEQYCNAMSLKKLGVQVYPKIDSNFSTRIRAWLEYDKPVLANFPNHTDVLTQRVLNQFNELNSNDSKRFRPKKGNFVNTFFM